MQYYCGFRREWLCAQAYVKVNVGAVHSGVEKDKQNVHKGVVYWYGRKKCVLVHRREIDGKKVEKKTQ